MGLDRGEHVLKRTLAVVVCAVTLVSGSNAAGSAPSVFTTTELFRPSGDSEPAVAVASDGTLAISALLWDRESLADFVTNLWTVGPTSLPTFQGPIDAALQKPAKVILGGGDADLEFTSAGTLQVTTLVFLGNTAVNNFQFGVSAIRCPFATQAGFNTSACSAQLIDTAGAERPWLTADGTRVWIGYWDSRASGILHVRRSVDDGRTWRNVGDAIVGQGQATADATFNNSRGPIVADSFTHSVYAIYLAGEPQTKCCTGDFNNVYVARSNDGGKTWAAALVHHDPPFIRLNNAFPALAADPTNGRLYAVWSNVSGVFVSSSMDRGAHWSTSGQVSTAPVNTAVMPWVAARNGTVDIVYYGTSATTNEDPSAVWHVYLAQSIDGGTNFAQRTVNPSPNHIGVICTRGGLCPIASRTLLDLFEVTIDPVTGKAAVVYTDDNTPLKTLDGFPLSQVVLARES